ncbi:MAG: S8 family serine peptidase [Planctomycetota bacterium]
MLPRKLIVLLLVLGLGSAGLAQYSRPDGAGEEAIALWHGYEVIKGEALVQFRDGTPAWAQMRLHEELGVEVLEETTASLHLVRIPEGMTLDDLIALYEAHEDVEFAQPNAVHRPVGVPNDPKYGSQWGLPNIKAPQAWDTYTGNPAHLVAIVDTGVRTTHTDLNDHYAGGYDYYSEDSNPSDNYGHGTHCCGIAAAETNNGNGIAGVAYNCRFLGYRCGDYYFNSSDLIQAINDAKNRGALAISMSWGSSYKDSAIESALISAYNAGCVNVAAAGNDGSTGKFYPAALACVIGVASHNSSNSRSWFSNYGSWVMVSAPGESIYSTYNSNDNSYTYMDGTSMACPHVSGMAVILYSLLGGSRSKANSDIVRNAIQDSAIPVSWVLHGRVDLDAAMDLIGGGGGGDCPGSCVEPWNYGTGTAGSGGFVPHMSYRTDRGCPYLGNPQFTIKIERALGGASGVFFLGFGEDQVDGGGWTLWVDISPVGVVLPIRYSGSGAGNGTFEISFAIPNNPYYLGMEICTQGTVADPAAPYGVAASEALKSVVCN